jgi:N-acetylmuramic acid 6-phosphate etherase
VVTRPDLDVLPPIEVVDLVLDAERRVVPAVHAAREQIAAAAELLADRIAAGGRAAFVGAGASGRIAVAEAAELPGTFGLDRAVVPARIAGGFESSDDDEDDLRLVPLDSADLALGETDVLVAAAASGTTPYTLGMATAARASGAAVIAVVTVPGSKLTELAEVAIEIEIGAEVLRGSTRLTAGTAQKIALNALTTAAMARLGRVHGDLMIDVQPANAKLRARLAGIVAEISGCDLDAARVALDACDGSGRAAVLHLVLGLDPDTAKTRAADEGTLRAALTR